ncbi:MAG: thiamine ABC transporter substrate-binding protein [Treponema sp.]|nr:thiamine ABC transporter substrate-binding protein [Treponema sp.]
MTKSHLLFISLLVSICMLAGCQKKTVDQARLNEVVVYTYDSFVSDWGAGPEIKKRFEEKTGLNLTFVDCGNAVQVLSRAVLEKDAVNADVILGLDNNIAQKAISEKILESYKPKDADSVLTAGIKEQLGKDWELIPYDYSHFAIIYDTRANLPEPKSLEDLTKDIYKKKIILMDPRTSTPGLGFVAWTVAALGDAYTTYWAALKNNILTMAPGWSSGYGLFTKGEAPFVISYTTSPAANIEYDKIDYYKALVFEQGHIAQVEGAGILKNAPNKKGAQTFIDFLISEDAQSVLPLTQWMYPANKNVALPKSYAQGAVTPAKTLTVDPAALDAAVQKVMDILK